MYENVDRGGIIIKEGVEVATKYSENIMILVCGISMENHNLVTWTPPIAPLIISSDKTQLSQF